MNAGVDLVTGGAGFIGSELVGLLVAAGRRVVVLDDLSAGRAAYLDEVPRDRCTLVRGTILDRGLVQTLLGESERVFHLAARGLRQSIHDPEPVHAVNATGTLVLLEAARRARIERFIHVSSSEVYGPARTAPMDETHPTHPTTPYGASKLAGEAYARAAFITHGLPVVVVRPFNVFGPRSHHEGASGEVIPRFMLRALAKKPLIVFGDGIQTRGRRSTSIPPGVAAAIGPRTRAILAVHQMGMPCDLARLLPIAEAHGLSLIEDGACAAGSEIRLAERWEKIGRPHGLMACFSFYPRKLLTTG